MPSGGEKKKVTIKIPVGSSSKSDSRSNHSRDSGIGSSSSRASSGIRPDHYYTAPAGEDFYSKMSPRSLEEALKSAYEEIHDLKRKCVELDVQLSNTNKKLREAEARWRAEYDHSQEVDGARDALVAHIKRVEGDNSRLNERVAELEDDLHHALSRRSKSSSPADEPKIRGGSAPKRRESHKGKDKAKPPKEDKDQRERLQHRFETKEPAMTMRPKRRDSYVEPLGQAAPRSSSSRTFPRVETTRHQPAAMSNVMMNATPNGLGYQHGRYEPQYDDPNDGNYHLYPIQ